MIDLRNALKDSYIFSMLYRLFHFFPPLKPSNTQNDVPPNILIPGYKEQRESQPYLIFYCKLIPFKITKKPL